MLLTLLVFIGEAVRDALDPRRAVERRSDQGAGFVEALGLASGTCNRCQLSTSCVYCSHIGLLGRVGVRFGG